jgi:hypothetical protein
MPCSVPYGMEVTSSPLRPELDALLAAYDAVEADARTLTADLPEVLGRWRARPDAWSVAECLDHLATANRVYLEAMRPAAERARSSASTRPALPGVVGRWFIAWLEPPVKPRLKGKAPKKIRPRSQPPLADAFERFIAAHRDARAFVEQYASINFAGVRFVNPFIPGVRFSLATGIHVIAAHERRHLWHVRREAARQPA